MIYFTAHTINCVCHSIRAMFRVLGIYNFGLRMNFFLWKEGSYSVKCKADLYSWTLGQIIDLIFWFCPSNIGKNLQHIAFIFQSWHFQKIFEQAYQNVGLTWVNQTLVHNAVVDGNFHREVCGRKNEVA